MRRAALALIVGAALSGCADSTSTGQPTIATLYAGGCDVLALAAPIEPIVIARLDPTVQADVRIGLDALGALCPPPADPTQLAQDLPRVVAAVARLAPLLARAPEVAGGSSAVRTP